MKNKIIRPIIANSLVIFCFYYTDELNKEKFETNSVDAKIINNTIMPGIKGKEVDKKVSYTKMKKYGIYNESLTTLKEVAPTVSIKDYYDKYVVQGNDKRKQVSLIFIIDSIDTLNLVTNYLDLEQLSATLFIKDNILDEVKEKLSNLNNYEIELIFDEESQLKISSSSNYLDSITSKPNKYCYTEKENDKLLNLCRKFKMHTIIPTFILNRNPTNVVKQNLRNGSIIAIEITNQIEKELDYILSYIRSKGYSFVRLDQLLEE